MTGNARQGQVDAAIAVGMDAVYIKRESKALFYLAEILTLFSAYDIAEIVRRIDLEGQRRCY